MITEEIVKNIRAMHRQSGNKYGALRAIADHFDLPYSMVSNVVKRESWRHVADDGRVVEVPSAVANPVVNRRGNTSLTEEEVLDIKALARQHIGAHGLGSAIAEAMELEQYAVTRVLMGRTYDHLKDDGRICSLELVFKYKTQSDEKKATVSGENSGKATITEETVRNVLALARQHGTGRGLPPAIAKAVGITTNQAHQIINRHTWASVVDDGRTCDLPVTVVQWERRDNPNQLVTEEHVKDIKALARQYPVYGVARAIADAMDLPIHVVQRTISGKNWSHVTDDGRTCSIDLKLKPKAEPRPKSTDVHLTDEQVLNVKALARQHGAARGLAPAIAKAVGVKPSQARLIMQGKTWTHLADDGRICPLSVSILPCERRGPRPNQLVDEEIVRNIKAAGRHYKDDMYRLPSRIANALGLPAYVVKHILSGKNWSHIPDDGRTCPIELPVRGPNKKHSAVLPPLNEPAPSATLS